MGDYLAIGALSLSLLTFIITQVRTQKAASADHVKTLEARLEKLEAELTASRAEVERLEDENLRLMRKLLANGVK